MNDINLLYRRTRLENKGVLRGTWTKSLPPKSCEFTKSPRKDSLCAPRVAAETVSHFRKVMKKTLCAVRVGQETDLLSLQSDEDSLCAVRPLTRDQDKKDKFENATAFSPL